MDCRFRSTARRKTKNSSEIFDRRESKNWVIHVRDELTVESSENLRVLPDPMKTRRNR